MKATDIFGFFSDLELEQTSLWAKEVPANGVIVEVGSFLGRSSVGWATACDPSVKVYCIDVFEEIRLNIKGIPENIPNNNGKFNIFEIFKENTKDIKNIYPIKARNVKELPDIFDKIDIFFIDASHTNPSDMQYILHFIKFIKPGGLICGHDFTKKFPDVLTNVAILEKIYKTKVQRYQDSTLWSFRI
jgi:predicted O-methyltransferase YrrM